MPTFGASEVDVRRWTATHGPWVRYEDHIAALAAGQAAAAQAVVQDDLITIRKPTTSAEMLWLLKLAHLVISDEDKTLEKTFAPAQPAAQQGVAYAASLIENLHL